MEEIKYCSLKIQFTAQETISVSIILNEVKILIKLRKEDKTEYQCSIAFDNNKIIICQESRNSIHFINDFMNNPEEFKEKRVSHIRAEMRRNAIDNVLSDFAAEWKVAIDAISYSADRYELGDAEIPGLNNLKKSADFDAYALTHGSISKFKYHQAIKKALADLLVEEIIPLRDDNFRVDGITT